MNAAIGVRLMYCQRNSAGAARRRSSSTPSPTHREPGLTQQPGDLVGVVHGEDGAHEAAKVGTDVLDDCPLEMLEDRLDPARRVDHHSARRREHPAHLGDSGGAVLHEHQAHLAQHDVD